jgi:hypothetical protein
MEANAKSAVELIPKLVGQSGKLDLWSFMIGLKRRNRLLQKETSRSWRRRNPQF